MGRSVEAAIPTLPLPRLDHHALPQRGFAVAREARERGDHPFGAILVGPDGGSLMEQGNGAALEGGDRTAHAERLLGDAGVAGLWRRISRRLHAL